MSEDLDPVLRNWYRHLDKGQEFRVVAVDEAEGSVDIQYFDGGIESIDFESWYELDIEAAEAPENWSGAEDIAEADDLGSGITDTAPEDWRAPQEELGHSSERDPLIKGEEESDDWGEGNAKEEPWQGEP